jgi:alpha-beta hydrolase superfamily lysophospholipase
MAVTHSDTQWLASDGTKMHAVRWSPDVPPKMMVCIIHGLGEHSGRYAHMAEYYASFGVEVVSFDLRGHGKSGGQRGHCDDFQQLIRDIDRFLNQVSKVDLDTPCFIYGHSLGATLVLQYALTHPGKFKGVIVSSPMLKPAFEPPKWKVILGRKIQSIWPTLSLFNEVDINTLSRDKDVLRKHEEDPLTHDRISARLGTQMLEAGEQLLKDVSPVSFPLLMMHGDDDKLTSYKATTLFSTGAGDLCTLKIWEGFYHELHHEPKKEEVYNYCLGWMERQL